MTVSLIPKNKTCSSVDLANQTWFTLCAGPLVELTGVALTNDPIGLNAEESMSCAKALSQWEPKKDWFMPGDEEIGKQLLIEFFVDCGGFETC